MVAHRLGRAVCEFNADLAVGRETAVLVVERDDEVEHPALGRGRILGAANGDAARGANRHFFYNSGQGPCSDLRSSDPTILPESLIAQIASSPVTTPSVASECARLQIPYRIVQARNFWATEAIGCRIVPDLRCVCAVELGAKAVDPIVRSARWQSEWGAQPSKW